MHLNVTIEPLRAEDAAAVSEFFIDALSKHYDGDHGAHFRRLLTVYDNANIDHLGYNSTHQIGVVARSSSTGIIVGFLNYVIKRQGTAKISPLIVAPEARGNGVGKRLLDYMREALSDSAVRSIYCTVNKQNKSAVRFFIDAGFRIVGSSRGQYMDGHSELVLQRPVTDTHPDKSGSGICLIRGPTRKSLERFQKCNSETVLSWWTTSLCLWFVPKPTRSI